MRGRIAFLLGLLTWLGADPALAAWNKGFNFRATSGYVTDGTNETYVLGDTYPTTRNGVTFGWLDVPQTGDRNSTVDRRLAGINYQFAASAAIRFQVDLPATGNYQLTIAMGDAFAAQADQYLEIRDTTTVRATLSGSAANFIDASNVSRTTANWPAQNVTITRSFTTSTLIIAVGRGSSSNNQFIAHLFVSQVPTASSGSRKPPRRFGR